MVGSGVMLSEKEWDIPSWKVLFQVAAIHLISKDKATQRMAIGKGLSIRASS